MNKKKIESIYKIIVYMLIFSTILVFIFFIIKNKSTEVIKISDNVIETENKVPSSNIEEPPYIDDNPIILGIYGKNSSNTKRFLVSEITKPWSYHNDIIEYNVFFTQDSEIETTRLPVCFDKYLARYTSDVSNYRIGYTIQFETADNIINKTIKSPKDVEEFYDFLEVYLYDGYHRKPGEWYSHTTEEEFNNETLLLGIKLTAGKKISEVTSDILLTAFSYDNTNFDDFDIDGNYRGDSKYSIIIKKQES